MAKLVKTDAPEVKFIFEFTETEVRDVIKNMGPKAPTGQSYEVFSVLTAAIRSLNKDKALEEW